MRYFSLMCSVSRPRSIKLYNFAIAAPIVGAARAVDTRARLLDAEEIVDEAALDKYEFLRDAYLQRRRSLIYDGNPPDRKSVV